MGQLSAKLRSVQDGGVTFWCPGCQAPHHVTKGWAFDGNVDRPTFSPSVLVRSGHFIPGHTGPCWCSYNREHPNNPAPFVCTVCHSFVVDGRIQFLGDCTHALVGQTVEVPELPPHMRDEPPADGVAQSASHVVAEDLPVNPDLPTAVRPSRPSGEKCPACNGTGGGETRMGGPEWTCDVCLGSGRSPLPSAPSGDPER